MCSFEESVPLVRDISSLRIYIILHLAIVLEAFVVYFHSNLNLCSHEVSECIAGGSLHGQLAVDVVH